MAYQNIKRGSVISAILALSIALMIAALPLASAQQQSLSGVASVIDGDTIEIHGERIRLSGFDAPESGARCGRINVYTRAANALADRIAGRTVSCTSRGRDAYGRITATCATSEGDLGDYLVRAGWARDWPRYSGGRYAAAEADARAARLGIWGMTCPANLWGDRDYSTGAASPDLRPQSRLGERAFVTASSLNVRAGAGAEHEIIGRLPRGSEVTIEERAGAWARLASTETSGGGWVSADFIGSEPPPAAASISDSQIRRLLMQQSLAYYAGSCPCPYNVDRAGRQCGRRSAYSRPGGASPLCYPSDVSDAQIAAYRSRLD